MRVQQWAEVGALAMGLQSARQRPQPSLNSNPERTAQKVRSDLPGIDIRVFLFFSSTRGVECNVRPWRIARCFRLLKEEGRSP
eukprot:symbB.v1.2.035082.t1/scaffold4648.1/size53790/1